MSEDDNSLPIPGKKFVPVCAIGASAGGVTALQQLFRLLPADLGLAYVIILHLSPDQPSALSEILSACTSMPVHEIQDAPLLRRDCVYVIPPDRELVIDGDSVDARNFEEPRGRRAPIDKFFRSVAAARGDGIAVVLSGAGADGALGVRAVKEAGGVIVVQEPSDAAFASMPQSAIASGVADFVAPIPRLVERLVEIAHSKEAVRSLDMDGSANDLRRIVAFLRARTGHDFSSYKRSTIMRRVIRRMQVCHTDTTAAYADYLLTTPEEAKDLFSDLLISVTMFFRDPRAFDALEHHVVKPVFDQRDPMRDEPIRAWVVGCATGEEAYSIAMLLHEEAARRNLHLQVQIFATDLDEAALATAREGRYPRTIEADVRDDRLARFFTDEGTHYRVRKELRDSVVFASHSVIKDPPFTRLDLITCRNLLIYLERTLQQQLCAVFHHSLKASHFLFLGSAETADAAPELFAPLERDARIYASRINTVSTLPLFPQFASPAHKAGSDPLPPGRTERSYLPVVLHTAALEQSAPASVLVDDAHNILHLSPSAGRFLLQSGGVVSNVLPVIVRPELRADLRLALARAIERKEPTLTYPAVVAFEADRRRISMHVTRVPNDTRLGSHALVFFLDGGSVSQDELQADVDQGSRPDETHRLQAELKFSQESLVTSQMGHDAAVQDLRASNEELQSINEEYRSTAEELETSKEELQSINEELHTINAELKSKLSSISVAHNDLQNLTSSNEIGTLFLDPQLRIRMFTQPVADLFNITAVDIGRPITNFTHQLKYDQFEADVQRVLNNSVPIEVEVPSKSGLWYVVRLRPYRTLDDRIEGTVVTFVDITARREMETALRESEARYRLLIGSVAQAVWEADADGVVIADSPTWRAYTGQTLEEWLGYGWLGAVHPENRAYAERQWREAIATRDLVNAEFRLRVPDGGWRWTNVCAAPVIDETGNVEKWVGMNIDIDDRRSIEAALRASEERYQTLFATSPVPFMVLAANPPDFTITAANDAYLAATLTTRESLIGRRLFDVFTDDPDRPGLHGSDALALSLDRVLASRRKDEMERVRYDLVVPGGYEPHWWLAINAPMLDASGEITTIIHQVTRVTDLHLAEEALREAGDMHRAELEQQVRERTAELEESRDLMQATMDSSIDMIQVFKAVRNEAGEIVDFRWVLNNHTSESRYGEARGQSLLERNPGVVQEGIFDTFRRVVETGQSEQGERHYGHEQFEGWFYQSVVRLGDGVATTTKEISDWKAAQAELMRLQEEIAQARLHESEERLRQFGEASQDVLWIRDATTLQWQYLSPAFETIFGLSRTDALSGDNYQNWQGLIVAEDRAHAVESIERVRLGENVTFEYRIRRPVDGEIRWLRDTDVPMVDADGQVQRIGGVGHDVTALKRMEEMLRDREGRLRVLMEGVPQLFWRSSVEGLWTWASPQWLDYTGQSQEESQGWGWLDAVHPDDQAVARQAWHDAQPHGPLQVEYRVRRVSDGAWRWHQARSVPVPGAPEPGKAEGLIVEWLGTTTDIDDLKHLQGEQQVLVAELQHRTRNLLAVVRNVARRSIDPSPGLGQYDARLSAIGRVQGFLSRSSAYSVPLADIVQAELEAAGDIASDRVQVDGPAVELPGESVQAVALALHELATNAVKYGAIAQPAGRLSVTWRVEGGDGDDGRHLVIDWWESRVIMPEGPPARRGYGSELITRALPYQLGARTTLEFTPDGVKCRVSLPANAFTIPSLESVA